MNDRTDALLMEIQQAALCLYQSDLRSLSFDDRAKKLLYQIPNDRYTLAEWNKALAYIRNRKSSCATIDEAKEKLAEQD